MSRNDNDVWLIGAGSMAVDYLKVLQALDAPTVVVGRGTESAQAFTDKTGASVFLGGLDAFLAAAPAIPRCAIVAVGVEALAGTTWRLLDHGVRRILVEKPGALTRAEIRDLGERARSLDAQVLIAYNRRTFASTLRALEIIREDGGVQSLHFEFTEWGHVIRDLKKAEGVKGAWLIGNSSHVIDLAFYLGGLPVDWQAFISGSLDWHPASSVFAGAGRTDRGALFSYQANWDAPGRWGVEILTSQSRLVFRPMESLQIVRKGSVAVSPIALDDRLDKIFKPGLFEQVRRYLDASDESFCSLAEQVVKWDLYSRMAGYAELASIGTSSPAAR